MNEFSAESLYNPLSDNEMSRSEHPTYGESFKIERLAVRQFLGAFPEDWLDRVQIPDFAVDFQMEVVENGEPTGFRFAVQIKGVRYKGTPKLRKSIETKSLIYLREKEKVPAFIFLIDIDRKTAHWVFAQRYLHEEVSRARFKQKSISIRFDQKNNLGNFENFVRSLRRARQFMEALYPGPPQAAISKKRVQLEALDPRFRVKIGVTEDTEAIHLTSTEPIALEISRTKVANEDIAAFVNHAKPLRVPVNEINAKDSPLLKELLASITQGDVQINPPKHPGCVRFEMLGQIRGMIQVDGEWRVGLETATFTGFLSRSPLELDSTICLQDCANRKPADASFSFNWLRWEGIPLNILPWLDELHKLVKSIQLGAGVRVVWFIDGQEFFIADMNSRNEFAAASEMLDWLKVCRSICRQFDLRTEFPKTETITRKMMRDVNELGQLLEGHEVRESIPLQDLVFRFINAESNFPQFELGQHTVEDFTIDAQAPEFSFLGDMISFGPVKMTYSDVILKDQRKQENAVELVFSSTPSTQVIFKLLNTDS